MTRLNQILAIEKREKTSLNETVTRIYHLLQKNPLLAGMSRRYQPTEDVLDNQQVENFPDELARVQVNAEGAFKAAATALIRILDLTATKDWANTKARANVVLKDGTELVREAPVTYLLFLEKQLVDLETLVKRLPQLDPAYQWEYDEGMDAWRWTTPVQTNRTKKIPRVLVKYPHSDKHPAQVDTYTEDVVVGTYTKFEYSGAVPPNRVRELLERIQNVQRAVKMAREEANMIEVVDVNAGQSIISYVLNG